MLSAYHAEDHPCQQHAQGEVRPSRWERGAREALVQRRQRRAQRHGCRKPGLRQQTVPWVLQQLARRAQHGPADPAQQQREVRAGATIADPQAEHDASVAGCAQRRIRTREPEPARGEAEPAHRRREVGPRHPQHPRRREEAARAREAYDLTAQRAEGDGEDRADRSEEEAPDEESAALLVCRLAACVCRLDRLKVFDRHEGDEEHEDGLQLSRVQPVVADRAAAQKGAPVAHAQIVQPGHKPAHCSS